jgi:serine protease Do
MRRLSLLFALSVSACGSGKSNVKGSLTPKDIVARSSPAIVFVEVGEGDVRQTGTGFILDKTGLIATNLHVVRGNTQIRVKLFSGETYPVMQIAGVDPGRDLAVLRIQPAKHLPTVKLGDSAAMAAGDPIIAIGNPLGVFDYSVSSGLVSRVRPMCTPEMVALHDRNRVRFEELAQKRRTPDEEQELAGLGCPQELTILQISAPISQGSSGGPLFNQQGEVVGVTTAIITGGQNINLAIPTNYLKPIVKHPGSISLSEFATKTKERDDSGDSGPANRVVREVPEHSVALLAGCNREQLGELVKAIWGAIEIGAPLYNRGDIEACFRIYEGTAIKYSGPDAGNSICAGVQTAFTEGLKRARSIDGYKLKAWAMRDTFDGLLKVVDKWATANGGGPIKPSRTK